MHRTLFLSTIFLLFLAGYAAQSEEQGDPRYEWLNGKWESRTKVFSAEFKVVNRDALIGEATMHSGRVTGPLRGKIIDDNTIQFNVDWSQRTTEYDFRKQDDGSLRGTITKGRDVGTTIRLRKQD